MPDVIIHVKPGGLQCCAQRGGMPDMNVNLSFVRHSYVVLVYLHNYRPQIDMHGYRAPGRSILKTMIAACKCKVVAARVAA